MLFPLALLRQSARSLRRAPAFTAAAALTLGVALGLTTGLFSVVDGVLLRALPLADPDRTLALVPTARGEARNGSPGLLAAWSAESRTLEAIGAAQGRDATLLGAAGAERLGGLAVSGQWAAALGARAAAGRTLGPADDVPGAPRVVVLAHRTWRTQLGGDPAAVGRALMLDGVPHTVVGVLPPALDALPDVGAFWVPLRLPPSQRANFTPYLSLVGRLRPGATPGAAAAELARLTAALGAPARADGAPLDVRAVPLLRERTAAVRRPLLLLLGATVGVLLIGCANVSTLVLARSLGRGRELAVRAALGAGRGRLLRELAAEHLLLGGLATLVAVPVATLVVRALAWATPGDLPRLADVAAAGVDGRALAFALALGTGAALACGIAAALGQGRLETGRVLQAGGGRGATATHAARWRRLLVATEVALTVVLLAGAGLLLRSARALGRVQPGYDATGVLTARLALPARDYPAVPRAVAGFEAVLAAARRAPGVAEAALVSRVPLGGSATGIDVAPRGGGPRGPTALRLASPGYFRTLRIPLLAGRDLTPEDRAGAPAVVVVNATLARRLAGDAPLGTAVGRTLVSDNAAFPHPMTVVGVVGDVRDGGPREATGPELYAPLGQVSDEPWDYWIERELLLVAAPVRRDPAAAAALAPALRRAVASVDPRVPLHDVRTTGTRLAEALAVERLSLLVFGVLGASALLLAAVGIHGVVLYEARRRTREVGIRVALGASPRAAAGLLVRQGMRPVLGGMAVGAALALAGSRLLTAQLFGVSPADPASLLGAGAALAAVALGSCWAPARRAAAVDPSRALRAE